MKNRIGYQAFGTVSDAVVMSPLHVVLKVSYFLIKT